MNMENIKPYIVGAVVAGVAVPVVLMWGNVLHTSSSLQSHAQSAVIATAADYCARDALAAEGGELVEQLNATTSAPVRSRLVRESGYATLPGTTAANRQVADLCAQALRAS